MDDLTWNVDLANQAAAYATQMCNGHNFEHSESTERDVTGSVAGENLFFKMTGVNKRVKKGYYVPMLDSTCAW